MPRSILYLLRRPPDETLRGVLLEQVRQGVEVRLLLCQEAAGWREAPPGVEAARVLDEGTPAGATAPEDAIGWEEALDLIHGADAALVW